MILEDESVIVLNRGDLGHNVCVLAVDGYGERAEVEASSGAYDNDGAVGKGPSPSGLVDLDAMANGAEFRGLRKWRDSVGGATLCCSQCCSTLGFASLDNPDSCRLFKHCLSSLTRQKSQRFDKNIFARNTCASFLAKDMIRYAESQAVFTFLVTSGRVDSTEQSSDQGYLLLKLLSWDTAVATSTCHGDERMSTPLTKGIKVIYEFVDASTNAISTIGIPGSADSKSIDDIMTWTWGGADLCCPPFASGNSSRHASGREAQSETPDYGKASVQIFLTEKELSQVKNYIKAGSSLFPDSVSKVSILLKLGNDEKGSRNDSRGLSVIPLF